MRPLGIEGAFVHEPKIFPDSRGSFHEWFRAGDFRESTGHPLNLVQANCSVSGRGTLRGLHYADVPPSQAKYVKCVRGAVLDVIVDIRVGSPTFGQWEGVRLDDELHHSVYLAEGLGHAFMALTDDATVVYLCSEGYSPNVSTESTRSTPVSASNGPRASSRCSPTRTPPRPPWPRHGPRACCRPTRTAWRFTHFCVIVNPDPGQSPGER